MRCCWVAVGCALVTLVSFSFSFLKKAKANGGKRKTFERNAHAAPHLLGLLLLALRCLLSTGLLLSASLCCLLGLGRSLLLSLLNLGRWFQLIRNLHNHRVTKRHAPSHMTRETGKKKKGTTPRKRDAEREWDEGNLLLCRNSSRTLRHHVCSRPSTHDLYREMWK